MKKFLSIILFIFTAAYSYAAVKVPDFSFTGQDEISGFSIRPSFRHVNVSFSVQSTFDSYLKQEKFKMDELSSDKYAAKDPGGMYSGGFGTALSSVFVGDKAYRNNIVKSYLDRQYLSVIQSYKDYWPKIEKTDFAEEVNLVYAMSLLETGSISQAFDIIKKIASGEGSMRGIAMDRYSKYCLDNKSYADLDTFVSGLDNLTSYTLYAWLYSLMKLEDYDKVIKAFEDNQQLVAQDPRFYDFYITARYSQGGFDDVISMKDKLTDNTAGIIADSCLVRGNTACVRDVYEKIPDSSMKSVIFAKLAIAENRDADTPKALDLIASDEDRLNVLFYYISMRFPKLDTTLLDKFKFASSINYDYVKFYKGLYYLSARDNVSAVKYLDGIIFNKELINTSYYYRGLAYSTIDSERAKRYLLRFIELTTDKQKLMVSRYMLGQLYYLDGRNDDAMMLMQSCGTDYCRLLKSKIYLGSGDLASAWSNADGIPGDEASLVRASILYQRKMFDDAVKQLNTITNTDDQSDLLSMLCYLKLGDTKSASVMFNRHSKDDRFTNAYIDHLFLTGEYQKVLDLTDGDKQKYSVVRAKATFSLGRMKDAAAMFRSLIDSGQSSFDAWYGLLSAYQAMGDQQKFTDTAKEITQVKDIFDKKDFLVLQTAKMALDNKDTKLATLMLNHFFESFPVSVYTGEAHLLRGQLFRDTGRADQCLADADLMLKDGKSDDASFLKAECLTTSDKKAAIAIFEDLAKNSDRFKDLSYGKLIDLYDDPDNIFKAVSYFKDKDSQTYFSGLEKYLGKLKDDELAKKKPFVDMLIVEGNPAGMPMAYYYSALISFNSKDYDESARLFMKSYYLYPDSPYSAKSLKKAAEAYDLAGNKDEAELMRNKLTTLKK